MFRRLSIFLLFVCLCLLFSCRLLGAATADYIISKGILKTGIHSERSMVGDQIKIVLSEDLYLSKLGLNIPKDSLVMGEVTDVQEAKRGFTTAFVSIDLDQIKLKDGRILDIQGNVFDWRKYRDIMGLDSSRDNKINGHNTNVQKALTAGKLGAGLVLGGPLGLAMATGSMLFEKRGIVRMDAGSEVYIRIDNVSSDNDGIKVLATKEKNVYGVEGKVLEQKTQKAEKIKEIKESVKKGVQEEIKQAKDEVNEVKEKIEDIKENGTEMTQASISVRRFSPYSSLKRQFISPY